MLLYQAEAEKNGSLSWEELALARFRLKVAEEFELGPSKQKKRPAKAGAKVDTTAADDINAMEIDAEGTMKSY